MINLIAKTWLLSDCESIQNPRMVRKTDVNPEGFLFKRFFYSWETQKERGRDIGRGRNRIHAGNPMWDLIPVLQDHTLSWRQTCLTPESPRCPMVFLIAKVIHPLPSAEGPAISLFLHTGNTFPDCKFYSEASWAHLCFLVNYSIGNP